MFQKAFTKLEDEETEKLLADLNPALEGSDFTSDSVSLFAQDLSFYPGYRLFDLTSHDQVPAARRLVVYKPGTVMVLDGTNTPIQELNKEAPLEIDHKTVLDYVRFYFDSVRGPKGFFRVIESLDDIPWYEEPPQSVRRSMSGMIKPVSLSGKKNETPYEVHLTLLYSGALFETGVCIDKTGEIRQIKENLLLESLSVIDEIVN